MTYKILITDDLSPESLAILNAAKDVTFDVVKGLTAKTLPERIPGYDGLIIRSSVTVTEDVLAAANCLKVIGRAGVGVDNVDVNAASMRGVIVMNTPGANTIAATEHAIALMLSLCRNIPQAHASLKSGKWDRKSFMGTQLYHKTIGIVGLGRIGTRVAIRCRSFGMDVLAYDPYLSDEVAHELKIEPVTLDELLSRSDFISLHAALTPQTEKIINAEAIAKMKKGVRLINVARGALIDEVALVEALRSGKITGAALDVFTEEPLSPDSPLLGLNNVVLTPHLAASTTEAQHDVGVQIVEQIIDALQGRDFRNAINMPIADAEVLQTLRPYLNLAEKVGSLQAQLADEAIQRVEVEVKGTNLENQIKPLTVAILKGLLEAVLHENVNYINAPHLARKRGIVVSQTTGLPTPDYPNLISCRVQWSSGERTVAATLFNTDEPRLVQIDNYFFDIRPEGRILVIGGKDKPGFIGRVGTILGEHNINIAAWRYGRDKPFGNALTFTRVDSDIPDEVMKMLLDFEAVTWIKKVKL